MTAAENIRLKNVEEQVAVLDQKVDNVNEKLDSLTAWIKWGLTFMVALGTMLAIVFKG